MEINTDRNYNTSSDGPVARPVPVQINCISLPFLIIFHELIITTSLCTDICCLIYFRPQYEDGCTVKISDIFDA